MLLSPIHYYPPSKLDFTGINVVTIYLGDTCNFDCVYCDREYIKQDIGSQNLLTKDEDDIVSFVELVAREAKDLKNISFHGGEPFLYIQRIDRLLERIQPLFDKDFLFFITTNGSLIKDNEWFFKKWGSQLRITLSYDFNYQEVNREKIDLKLISKIVRDNNAGMLFQFVIPSNLPGAFHHDTIHAVLRDMREANCNSLNLIPLRHHRGARKFKVLIDDMDLKWFAVDLMRFVHTMYVNGIQIHIDGNYDKIDKRYLNNHGKLILSPDGYIYPEFDYLEYKRTEFRIGQWRGEPKLYRVSSEEEYILPQCRECVSRDACGLKYLYKMFDETPSGACIEFYKIINLMVAHLHELKKKPTLMHWIGINERE